MIGAARAQLMKSQNADGGWGAGPHRRSNTETTALAILGLGTIRDPSAAMSLDRALTWLVDRQNEDGSWPFTDQIPEGSWSTALAALSLSGFAEHRARAARGTDWLLARPSRRLGVVASALHRLARSRIAVQLNPDLRGWSWTAGTSGWVEPTAYALLALKRLYPGADRAERVAERVREGELLLYDRMCEGGGWNYGNSRVLGVAAPPYPETTALALIALADHAGSTANQASLRTLERMLDVGESGLSLSWSLLCWSIYGQDVVAWRRRLAAWFQRSPLVEPKTTALALLAAAGGDATLRLA